MKKLLNNQNEDRISFVILDLLSHGGIRVIINIANTLAERGYNIHLYTSRKLTSVSFVISPMVNIHYATRIKNKVISYLLFPIIL